MDIVTPLVVVILLAAFTGIQAWINHGRFAGIDARFDRIDARFDRVDARFDRVEARVEQVQMELAELRSMIMQIALALGAQPRPQTG